MTPCVCPHLFNLILMENPLSIDPAGQQESHADLILRHLDDPASLETLYRSDKRRFRDSFLALYEAHRDHPVARVWYERLRRPGEPFRWGPRKELPFLVVAALLAGCLAKLPEWLTLDADNFYIRTFGFLVFPGLTAYFLRQWGFRPSRGWIPPLVILVSGLYIWLLPDRRDSDTLLLAALHLPGILWMCLGYAFTGGEWKDTGRRLAFLGYNGDLLVMLAILMLSGGLFTGVTINLYGLVGLDIEEFYFQQVAIWGLAALPLLATYLVRHNPVLVGRISPLVAALFTPVTFLALLVFLVAWALGGKPLHVDRDFLLLFNVLLVGVMAIVLFSITDADKRAAAPSGRWWLAGLCALTLVLNGMALSAISMRLSAFGASPNRLAVLGANLLMFIHLGKITLTLFRSLAGKRDRSQLGDSLTAFLPVYGIWFAFVTFLLPWLFGFA